jgi:phospholipid transport system substrate-binding protein
MRHRLQDVVKVFLFSAFVPASVVAQPGYYPPDRQTPFTQDRFQQTNPGPLLQEGIEKVLAFLEGGGASSPERLENFVEREIAPYFDFAYMTRWALGPRSRYMSREQLVQTAREFRVMFLSALARQLSQYEPGRIEYLRPRRNIYRGEMRLSVQSYPRRGYPVRLDFDFYQGRDGWKIYDVAANGQSALMAYREFFDSRFRGYRAGRGGAGTYMRR